MDKATVSSEDEGEEQKKKQKITRIPQTTWKWSHEY